jgi:hypothetical protein
MTVGLLSSPATPVKKIQGSRPSVVALVLALWMPMIFAMMRLTSARVWNWRHDGEGFKVSRFHAATVLMLVAFDRPVDCKPIAIRANFLGHGFG